MRKLHLVATALVAVACSHPGSGEGVAPAAAPTPPPAAAPAPAPVADGAKPAPVKPADTYLAGCRADIAKSKDLVAQIKAAKDHTVAAVLEPFNEVTALLDDAGQTANLYGEVQPDDDLRKAAETCTQEVAAYNTELGLDRALYEQLKAVKVDGADAATKRFLERSLRDFHRAGVDKDDATRAKLKDLAAKQVQLGLDFERNVREDVRKVKVKPAELAGVPADYIAAHPAGPDGLVEITTDYPDFYPVRTYATSAEARKKLYIEFLNRGYPKNEEVLRQLLQVRQDTAKLLGYANWADYATETLMVKSGKNAQDFIDKIAKAAEARERKDYATLLKRKRKDDPKATALADYELAYYSQLVKREQYAFDPQSVRPYFDFTQSRDALLMITGKMYGVEYRAVPDATKWDASVDVYDVFDKGQDGKKLGRIYLDLHPRTNKYKHAAMFPMILGTDKQLPEGALVTNFPTGLMDQGDVSVMFHEFGHLMHHVLGGKQHWVYFSGAAVETDFVEAPSQMFEEWVNDPGTLALFAKHNETHQPIPAELVKKMRAASEFGVGIDVRQQMFYAAMSLRFHQVDAATIDPLKLQNELRGKYAPTPTIEGTHMYVTFTHLVGYTAGYYGYMYSKVIAKDLFSEFKKHGLLDETTAHKYRDTILAPGGSKDANDLVKDFLGRTYNFEAYKAWLDGK
jgi:thimet oligopeptidase